MNEKGLTLLELLITLVISSIVITVIIGVFINSINYYDKSQIQSNLQSELQFIESHLKNNLKNSKKVEIDGNKIYLTLAYSKKNNRHAYYEINGNNLVFVSNIDEHTNTIILSNNIDLFSIRTINENSNLLRNEVEYSIRLKMMNNDNEYISEINDQSILLPEWR